MHPEPRSLVSYEANLLECACIQLQFGDWRSFTRLNCETLQHHPDRARLALVAVARWPKTVQDTKDETYIRLTPDRGVSKKLISPILTAGVHNNIGRATAIGNQQHQVLQHFENAIAISTSGSDRRFVTQPRISEQHQQLGLPASTFTAVSSAPTFLRLAAFRAQILATRDLFDACAGNIINNLLFRHHGILRHDKTPYPSFYVDTLTLRLVQRDLATDSQRTHDILGEYNQRDAHNSISLGVDRQVQSNVNYEHYATQLRYRLSSHLGEITAWTDGLPMTGAYQKNITYSPFILLHHNFPLALLYRDNLLEKGTARIRSYWNHLKVGIDLSPDLSFFWCIHTLEDEQRINNINIGYVYSHDTGLTWQTSQIHPWKLPITQVNVEAIRHVNSLFNQTSVGLDSRNPPYIVFFADDPDRVPQYRYPWFDGNVCYHQIVLNRIQTLSLQNRSKLKLLISRLEVVIDRQDNIFILTRGNHTQSCLTATFLPACVYAYEANNIQTQSEAYLGFADLITNREPWQQEHLLKPLLRSNEQPNHYTGNRLVKHPVGLIVIKLSKAS